MILYGVEETAAALAIRDAVETFVIRARSWPVQWLVTMPNDKVSASGATSIPQYNNNDGSQDTPS